MYIKLQFNCVIWLYIVSCCFVQNLRTWGLEWFSILMHASHFTARHGMLIYLLEKHFNLTCTCVCCFPWQVISQMVKSTPSISKGSRKFFRTLQDNGIFNICLGYLWYKITLAVMVSFSLENRCCVTHWFTFSSRHKNFLYTSIQYVTSV